MRTTATQPTNGPADPGGSRLAMPPDAKRSHPRSPGPESQDFESAERAAHDDMVGKDVLPSAIFPSVPESFFFSGRTGHPPRRLGWSPVVPGKFGKETARNETCFFEKPRWGPRRRYGSRMAFWVRTPPTYSPRHRGRKHIIGPGFWIVLSFGSEFFSRRPEKGSWPTTSRVWPGIKT
jgi:hypothetical protein